MRDERSEFTLATAEHHSFRRRCGAASRLVSRGGGFCQHGRSSLSVMSRRFATHTSRHVPCSRIDGSSYARQVVQPYF
jgi:hypothetical protein